MSFSFKSSKTGNSSKAGDWKTATATLVGIAALGIVFLTVSLAVSPVEAGAPSPAYKVLDPIRQGNLTVFPVVAATTHDTSEFLTLDEGLRSGEVVVTEAGRVPPMIRRRPVPLPRGDGAEVNRLMLINNSEHPLILLAGEIVTGGKQDRVVGRDRIVPPKSDSVDLSVFCVEPGRWTAVSEKFGGLSAQMAQPSVRKQAMANRDQAKVWDEVRKSNAGMAAAAPSAASAIVGTTSYAQAANTVQVQAEVDKVAQPIAKSYESLLHQLREKNAVGVVVAVGDDLQWADLFASQQLLHKYWPKLVRSYAAESITRRDANYKPPTVGDAQRFLTGLFGEHEISETEADVYRLTEVQAAGFRAFRLHSLLPKTDFDLHIAKMTMDGEPVIGMIRRH